MIKDQKLVAKEWFKDLRDQTLKIFLEIENGKSSSKNINKFQLKKWKRKLEQGKDTGGGTMAIMHGEVFEKVGVNISTVYGKFNSHFKEQVSGASKTGKFWASGISAVAHMKSPHIPSFHFNKIIINFEKVSSLV